MELTPPIAAPEVRSWAGLLYRGENTRLTPNFTSAPTAMPVPMKAAPTTIGAALAAIAPATIVAAAPAATAAVMSPTVLLVERWALSCPAINAFFFMEILNQTWLSIIKCLYLTRLASS